MVLFVLSGMGKYSAYSSGGTSAAVFDELPKTLKALLGFGSLDVTTISGFYAMLIPYLELTTAIHAALLGSNIIAKEERDKTAEFLIAKPVSRNRIVSGKLLAALFQITVVNLVSTISSILMVAQYTKGEDITGEILAFMLSMFLVQLIFLALGAALAAILHSPKASGSVSTSILLGAYVIAKITDLTDKVNVLNVLSPFKYFDCYRIIGGDGLNPVISILSLLLVTALILLTYIFYGKRDMHV